VERELVHSLSASTHRQSCVAPSRREEKVRKRGSNGDEKGGGHTRGREGGHTRCRAAREGRGGAPPLALIDGSFAGLGVGSLDPPALGPPFPPENLRPEGHDARPRRELEEVWRCCPAPRSSPPAARQGKERGRGEWMRMTHE
jgi:hypothetical protein